jgi:isoleucyl-tRNA synthetase
MGAQPGQDLNFDYKEYVDTFKVINTFWNSYLFAQEKMQLNGFNPAKHKFILKDLSLEDKWILSRTNTLISDITNLYEKYFLPDIPNRLQDYIMNDLSRWYITIIREKVELSNEDPTKFQTLAVLYYVLKQLLLLMAPVNPMLAESIYQSMYKPDLGAKAKKSIHLESWPKIEKKYISEDLEKTMSIARKIVDAIRALKTDNKIKLRWPTNILYIIPKESLPELTFKELILQMANVKDIQIVEKEPKGKIISTEISECKLILDIEDTKELQQERIVKDLLRTIQSLRKEHKFITGEKISITLATEHEFIKSALDAFSDQITNKVTASPLTITKGTVQKDPNSIYHEFYICINKNCYASVKENAVQNILSGKDHECGYCDTKITPKTLGKIEIQFKKV